MKTYGGGIGFVARGERPNAGRGGRRARVDSVPGFRHFRGLLGREVRLALIDRILAEGRWEPDSSRERQCHAFRYLWKNDALETVGDGRLPDWLAPWAGFILDQGWMTTIARQVTVQKYGKDSYLGPHIDSPRCFGPEIVTFSIESRCEFRMTNQERRESLVCTLEPGDVVVLQHEARDAWKHEVLRHKEEQGAESDWRRLSVTFRAVKPDRILY